jgi:hypothetical protein
MMKPACIVLGSLISSLALPQAFAATRSLPELIGEADYWQQLDWGTAPASAVWQDHNWVNYLGKQTSAETREKIQAFRLNGIEWQATLSRLTASKGSPYLLTIYTPADDIAKDRCDTLYNWAAQHFGPPQITMDGSYRLPASGQTAEHRTIDRHYQWTRGNTRITQECVGQFSISNTANPPGYAASFLRFTQRDQSPELHPLINARCSRTLHLSGSNNIPLRMSDFVFVLDENNGTIRRVDLVPLSVKNAVVASNLIRFSITLDKSNNEYTIERPSGRLIASMTISGIEAASVEGQCSLTPILTAQP